MKLVRVVACLVAVLGTAWGGASQALTPDQILSKVEQQSFFGTGQGSLYAALAVTIEEAGLPGSGYAFRVWAKEYPDETTKTLLLYAAPDLVAGTLYLAHTPKEGTGRMWLFLPALELLKELVSDSDRRGEFIAGSGITYDDVASGFTYREGYTATPAGEEAVSGATAWRLNLVPASPGQEWSQIRLWIHQEAFIVLRAEFVDLSGRMARILTVPELIEDAIGVRPARLVVEDLLRGGRATVEIETRSVEEIPDTYFEPQNLGELEL